MPFIITLQKDMSICAVLLKYIKHMDMTKLNLKRFKTINIIVFLFVLIVQDHKQKDINN